jgi:hypothetical protein
VCIYDGKEKKIVARHKREKDEVKRIGDKIR